MSGIHDALILAGQDREKLLHILPPAPQVPPSLPKEKDEDALIAATVEVKGLQHFYRAPFVRLTVFGVLLIAALASATVYLSNNARRSLGMAESTVFEGTMQPVAEVKMTALVPGIISNVSTHVGDAISEGDVLVTMDSHEAEEAVSRAQLAYDAAQRNLAQLRSELAQTEAQVSAASRAASLIPSRQVRDSAHHAQVVYEQSLVDHQRNEQLYKDGIIAKQVLDNTATALRIAKDDLDNAHKGDSANEVVQQLQGRQSDLLSQIGAREQTQQVKEARLALQTASARLANTQVRATSAGLVSVVSVKVGDQVSVGAPLIIVSRMDRITVNVPVAASMIASLRKLQQAQITLPTMPPQRVLGTVRAISPVPSTNMTHNVEVEFDNPTGQLLAGQPAEVRFVFQ
jgi:multidrug resistance efflux pump